MFDAVFRPGLDAKPGHGDSFIADGADPEGSVFDPSQSLVNLSNDAFGVDDESEGKILFPCIASEVGHVNRHVGMLAVALSAATSCLRRQSLYVAGQLSAFQEKQLFEFCELLVVEVCLDAPNRLSFFRSTLRDIRYGFPGGADRCRGSIAVFRTLWLPVRRDQWTCACRLPSPRLERFHLKFFGNLSSR